MNVYLDYILIENLIVNVSVILQTYIFTKNKINIVKLLTISVFLSIISVIKQFNICNNLFIQVLSINIAVYILFKPKKIITYFKQLLYFHTVYIEYIGIVIFITMLLSISINNFLVRVIIYIIVSIITYIINNFMWKIWINMIKYNDLKYTMWISEYKNLKFNLFLDTGNSLVDPAGRYEIIILNKDKYLNKIKKNNTFSNLEDVEILVSTAIGKEKLKGYIFKNVIIEKEGEAKVILSKAIILFIDEIIQKNKFDGLLSYNTYMEKMRGVIL